MLDSKTKVTFIRDIMKKSGNWLESVLEWVWFRWWTVNGWGAPFVAPPPSFYLTRLLESLGKRREGIDEEDPRPTSSTWSYIKELEK